MAPLEPDADISVRVGPSPDALPLSDGPACGVPLDLGDEDRSVRRARRLAVLLMALSAAISLSIVYGLWLALRAVL